VQIIGTNDPVRLGGLELASLYSLSVAQPLYDLIGRHPTFLSAHALQQGELIGFLCIISLVIPGALLLLLRAIDTLAPGAANVLRWAIAAALVVLLSCFITPQIAPDTRPVVTLIATGVIALAAMALLIRFALVREGLRLAAITVFVFPLLLLAQLPSGYLNLLSKSPATAGALRLRHDLFPNFARLAADSDWYVQSSTVASRTRLALPALLTGKTPKSTQDPNIDDHPQNLFTILASDYSLNVEESASTLCANPRCAGEVDWLLTAQDTVVVYAHLVTPKLFAPRLPSLTAQWSSFLSSSSNIVYDERVRKFDKWLARIADTNDPGLHFLHSLLPHIPYTTLPTTHRLFRHGTTSGHVTTDQRDELATDSWADVEARYLFLWQLQLVDRMVGSVIDHLQQSDRYDNTLFVVTADHGMRLAPGMSRRQPFADNYIDIAAIPVFVKRPGQIAPRRIERAFQSTDLLPVMLAEVGLDPEAYGLDSPDPNRQSIAGRRIRSYLEHIVLPQTLDLRTGLDWWPKDEQLSPDFKLPEKMPPCAKSMEVAHPEFYQTAHPEHYLAAHVLLKDPQQQQSNIVVEFQNRPWKALRSAPDQWSAFVSPDDFRTGFNALRVTGESREGWCVLFDNRVDGPK